MRPDPVDESHRRPEGTGDAAVAAAGRISEAFETTERAREHLYAFHQLTGHADAQLDAALALLRAAGRPDLADRVGARLLGRDVLDGRWTFQVVEEYDDDYFRVFREMEELVRNELMEGRRHVYEAEMKQRRQAGPDDPRAR